MSKQNLEMNTTAYSAQMASTVNGSASQTYESTGGNVSLSMPLYASTTEAIVVPIFFALCIIIGFIGNSLVIAVMTKKRTGQGQGLNNTNKLILNLAVADLLFLTFCVPFHSTIYTLAAWPFGSFLCFFSKFAEELTKIASVYSLVALSMDRFFAVAYATSARQIRTRKNVNRGLIFIWILAIGLAVPVLFTRVYDEVYGNWFCAPLFNKIQRGYEISIALLGYIIPLFIIITCYILLLSAICKTSRNSSIKISNSSNDSKKKVTKIVILIVIVFAICWLPHNILLLWLNFDNTGYLSLSWSFAFRVVAHCLSYANSCMNPLIYAFVSKKFRQDFKRAFTCQHLSEAVGSMKEFSRRMIGTVRYSRKGSCDSNTDYMTEMELSKTNTKVVGETSRTSFPRIQKFCPRSPLTPAGRIPPTTRENGVVTFDTESCPDTKYTQIAVCSDQDPLVNECTFDDEIPNDSQV